MAAGKLRPLSSGRLTALTVCGVHAPLAAVDGLADAAEGVVVFEEAGAPEVGEEIVGRDFEGGVAAPVVGIADADLEGAEFGDGFLLGGGGHPGEVFEADAEGGDEVGDDGFGLGLGFGGEEALGVDLADGVAEDGWRRGRRRGSRADAAGGFRRAWCRRRRSARRRGPWRWRRRSASMR